MKAAAAAAAKAAAANVITYFADDLPANSVQHLETGEPPCTSICLTALVPVALPLSDSAGVGTCLLQSSAHSVWDTGGSISEPSTNGLSDPQLAGTQRSSPFLDASTAASLPTEGQDASNPLASLLGYRCATALPNEFLPPACINAC